MIVMKPTHKTLQLLASGLLAMAASVASIHGQGLAGDTNGLDGQPATNRRSTEEGWFSILPRTNQKPLPAKANRAFVVNIHGTIGQATRDTIKRKLARCKASGADLIIFDMDTPGGRSDAMEDIVELILDELRDIYCVAYVNPKAFSAGAIVSLACDEIALSPTSVIGDAMPIMVGPQGIVAIPEKERGKIESAALAQIRVLAKRNGYNVALCEAMITITREIWLIENTETGELRAVNANEWRGRVAKEPATTQPVRAVAGPETDRNWQYVRTVADDNKLVTMTADEAIFLGFGTHIAENMATLEKHYNIAGPVTTLADTWSERLVEFLTSAPVVSFLVFVGLLCGYIEMHTPGFGIAGAIAIACFAVLFGSGFLIGLAAWWEIAVFILGLVLIAVEVFITPGFGVMGITGLLLCVIGLLATIIPNAPDKLPIPQTDLDWNMFANGLMAVTVGFLMAVASAVLLARYLPKVPIAGKLILAAPDFSASGPAGDQAPITRMQPGATGTVEGPCRPVGQVRFGSDLVDAIAEGEFLPAGTKVKVVRADGNRVVVTPVA